MRLLPRHHWQFIDETFSECKLPEAATKFSSPVFSTVVSSPHTSAILLHGHHLHRIVSSIIQLPSRSERPVFNLLAVSEPRRPEGRTPQGPRSVMDVRIPVVDTDPGMDFDLRDLTCEEFLRHFVKYFVPRQIKCLPPEPKLRIDRQRHSE